MHLIITEAYRVLNTLLKHKTLNLNHLKIFRGCKIMY
jgi:hypothetical protein